MILFLKLRYETFDQLHSKQYNQPRSRQFCAENFIIVQDYMKILRTQLQIRVLDYND